MKRLAIAAVSLSLVMGVVVSGCGGGGPADLTDREISDGELATMALPQEALGPTYADFGPDYDASGLKSNEDRANEALEEDEAEDVERFGRVTGYDQAYSSLEAVQEVEGAFYVVTGVDVFVDASGVSRYLKDDVQDSQGQANTTREGGTIVSVEEFDPGRIGDESAGLLLTATVSADQDSTFYETAVRFCRGRLLGSVFVFRFDDEDVREEVADVARKLDERMLAVLRGEVEPKPTPESLSLNEYLVLTLALDADMNRASADLYEAMPELQGDPEEYVEAAPQLQRSMSQVVGEALQALFDVTPPTEARAHHKALLAMLRDLDEILEELGAAIEVADPSRQWAAMFRFVGLLSGMGEVMELGQQLAIVALEPQQDDPLSSYLIAAAETRLQFATVFADVTADLQELLAALGTEEDLSALFAVFDELISSLEDFEDRWQELSPPPEAQQLHHRQLELMVETIASERALVDALRIEDEDARLAAMLAALSSFEPIAVKGPRLHADWDDLLIEALSR